tara:strand:+ start:137 stop:307 length:171 start_codon:yes stop_codon:yes gene_type:complete
LHEKKIKKKSNLVPLYAEIDEKIKSQVKELASQQRRSLASMVEILLAQALAKNDKV